MFFKSFFFVLVGGLRLWVFCGVCLIGCWCFFCIGNIWFFCIFYLVFLVIVLLEIYLRFLSGVECV